jgi:hypothetical protein
MNTDTFNIVNRKNHSDGNYSIVYRRERGFRDYSEPDLRFVAETDLEVWYNKDDKISRENDLPAVVGTITSEYKDVNVITQEWWVNGKRHRDGNFAVWHVNTCLDEHTQTNHRMEMWCNGVKHCEGNGEEDYAVSVDYEYGDYKREWWVNGQRHRDNNLPAVLYVPEYDTDEHDKEWWVNGIKQSNLSVDVDTDADTDVDTDNEDCWSTTAVCDATEKQYQVC